MTRKMTSRKKQEENHLKILKDLLNQPSNKKCLECDQRGPTYVDVTIGSFVCTSCGGILRGLNPPHRVKSISMTTFTATEITFIESRGNEWCRAVYLAKYDERSKAKPESKGDQTKLKHYMELKYEQKKWYESPSQQRKLMESAAATKKNTDTASTSSPPPVKPLQSLLGKAGNNVQIPSAKADIYKGITTTKINKPSADLLSDLDSPTIVAPAANNSVAARPTNSNSSMFSDGFADFDRAFGGFQSSPAPTQQQSFAAAFGQVSAQPIPFTNMTNSTASSTGSQQAISASDRYAALADLDMLFGKTETQTSEVNDFNWASPAKSTFPSNQTNLMQPPPQQQQQQAGPFGSPSNRQGNFYNPSPIVNNNVPSSSSWMSTPAGNQYTAASTWSATPSTWAPASQWQSTYQQTPNNAAAAIGNPFLAQAVNPQQQAQSNIFGQVNATGNDYGPWTQPTAPATAGYASNVGKMSSTNPFAMTATPAPATNYLQQQQQQQQPQNLQPSISNQSNPFMF